MLAKVAKHTGLTPDDLYQMKTVAINGGTVQATGAGFALWNEGTGAFTVQRPPAVITGNVNPANLLP